MNDIRLIALDLDGTLLTSDKRLSERTRAALRAAADAGVEIVPATGRFFGAMPEEVRALPFLRCAITINGAQVRDLRRDIEIYAAELPAEEAVEIMRCLDPLPVIYDCYMDDRAWMTAAQKERAAEFAPDRFYLQMLRDFRRPVPELKAFVRERGGFVQKVQFFARDTALRDALLRELPERFPEIAVSTSAPNNLEINHIRATKGDALEHLAAYLDLSREQTMAFGDGLNDVPMLRAAGVGVAMGNASPEAIAVADRVTAGNDDDGVAAVIEELLGAAARDRRAGDRMTAGGSRGL